MALKGYNAALEYGNTADYTTATTWTAIAHVKSIKPPKVTAKSIDTTHLASANEAEESIPGVAEGGDFELAVQYDKTATATVFGFFRTVKSYRVRYSDNSGWKLNGYIVEYGDDEVVNGDIVMTTLKVKVIGLPVPAADVTA